MPRNEKKPRITKNKDNIEARKKAMELFCELSPTGEPVYQSMQELHAVMKKLFPKNAPGLRTLYHWRKLDMWDHHRRLKRIEQKADAIATVDEYISADTQEAKKDAEQRKKLDQLFRKSAGIVVKYQLALVKKANEAVAQKKPSDPKLARMIEVADRVNYTAFQMLERLGYGKEEVVSPERPVVIIQEIGGQQNILINGGNEERQLKDASK